MISKQISTNPAGQTGADTTKFLSVSLRTWQWIILGLAVVLLVFFGGRFIIESYARAITNSNSSNGDQGAFLQLGLNLREYGILTDGTRNPLYAVFLAAIAERDWSYFTQAKLMSMTFGLLTIVAVFILGWRYFNLFTGLAAAYLLSINVELIVHSATALTESLLVLTFTLAWFAMLWALDDKRRWPIWMLAGLLVALAYLSKGSGQLLMFSFVITAFLFYRFTLFRSKSFWLFVLAYLVVVSPYWVYNTTHYGSPTFNYAISNQMWMERWNDWHPDDTDNLPTAVSYLQTHSPAEIFERQWEGMKAERNILVKTLYPTRTLMVDNFLLSPLSGITFFLLLLLPLLFWRSSIRFISKQRSAVFLTTISSIIFFMLFAWYTKIIPATRFLLPLAPPLFVMGCYIVSCVGKSIWRRGRWGQVAILAVAALVVVMQTQWWLRTAQKPTEVFLSTNLYEHDREFGLDAATPLTWLAEGYPGATVAWGPSGHSLPIWAFSDRLNILLYPPGVDNFDTLTDNFIARGIEFVVVDPDMVARHKDLLRDRFPSNGTTINLTAIPPEWALAFVHRDIPCEWCIFRLPTSRPAQQPVDYHIGEAIHLTGYDLDRANYQPGDSIHLTLHWTALDSTDQNLTVFTQLLGPDWQLHGQQDNQPVNNHWPTHRWQPGERLTDRYDISLGPDAPPGQYHVLVGMYVLETGERIPVTQNGQPVPDSAIFLTTFDVP